MSKMAEVDKGLLLGPLNMLISDESPYLLRDSGEVNDSSDDVVSEVLTKVSSVEPD